MHLSLCNALLPNYVDEVPSDVTLTYLTHPSKSCFAVEPLVVKREALSEYLSYKHCARYLQKHLPKNTFTHANVERCYCIFLEAARKATHIECMTDYRTDVCYESFYTEHGVFQVPRARQVQSMFEARKLLFVCYDIHQQTADNEWENCIELPLKERAKYPQFTLKELLDHDWAYEMFCKFWGSIPTHEDIRACLAPLHKDVIDYIFGMLLSTPLRAPAFADVIDFDADKN